MIDDPETDRPGLAGSTGTDPAMPVVPPPAVPIAQVPPVVGNAQQSAATAPPPLSLEQKAFAPALKIPSKPLDQPPVGMAPIDRKARFFVSEGLTRQNIGYLLIALMALIVAYGLVMLYLINRVEPRMVIDLHGVRTVYDGSGSAAAFTRLTSLLNILFGPIVTLVSSVTGFYFGAKSVADAPQSGDGASKTL